MKQIRDRVAGLDVHRDSVMACARISDPGAEIAITKKKFTTTARGLRELAAWLTDAAVTTVVMEATGVYWKPVFYALEGLFDEVWVCNAQHVKNVPGRKTDMNDAEWLADVAAHGMVRPSFIPPPPVRELRDLTRYRKTQSDARAQEILRLEKVLQDSGMKITSVASSVWSLSSRDMIEAMIAGEDDPAVLAQFARRQMRSKIPRLEEALAGRFLPGHRVLARQIIEHIDYLDRAIADLTDEITVRLAPFEAAITLLKSIPGISDRVAQIVVAETGADMSVFPTPGQLCAWAGLAPANYESAGKSRPAGTRRGSQWLRRALIESARAAARSKNSYYSAQYRRIASRRGPNIAAVAVAHSQLNTIWHMLTNGTFYEDPGPDWFQKRRSPEREAQRLTSRIEQLGYDVTITPAA